MNTNIKLNLADTARELAAVLQQRKSYEKVIRETQWMEGPLTIVGSGASQVAGLAAARTLEWLLGSPVSVRGVAEVGGYVLPSVRPRSVFIAVSPSGEDKDLLEIVRKVRLRGAAVLALTRSGESSLGRACSRVLLLPCAEEARPAVRTAFLEHAALLYVACLAASIFNPRHPLAASWEEDFAGLPDRLQWVHAHLGDAVQSVADAVNHARQTLVTGGGLYHSSALQAARLAWQVSGSRVQTCESRELVDDVPRDLGEADGVLLASGSSCRVKKIVHAAAAKLKGRNVRVLSVTDNNDQELVQPSSLAILLPVLSEVTGSLLELAVLQWIMLRAGATGA
jgi:D-arabinose 5-phosphate isomerase GutQ